MDWKTDLNILQQLRIPNKGSLIRVIYSIIHEHEGKDFKDLDDLLRQVFPHWKEPTDSAIKPLGERRRRTHG